MKTCTGKETKKLPKTMDEAVILQREIQQGHDDPQPLAIHPLYCQGYCEGFTIAKKMFKKKVKP